MLEVDVAEEEVFLGFEGGLLGIALHPEDGTRAEVDRVILDDIEAGGHHHGGRIRIGPDGLPTGRAARCRAPD